MRRKSLLGTTVLAAALSILLAACGAKTPALNNAATAQKSTPQPPSSTPSKPASPGEQIPFPLTVTDESGNQVTIPAEPQHIVSATEGTDEILSALVPKSKLAMVTAFSSDPKYSNITEFVKGIPQTKDSSAELIISAKPDLVLLASYTKQGVVDQIKMAHIPVFEFTQFNSISDIEKNIVIVGRLVGNESEAKKMTADMETALKAIGDAVKNEKKATVLDYSSYGFAAGSDTSVGDIIVRAGGLNAAQELKGWQKVSDEQVVKLNPDVIIVAASDEGFADKIRNNPALQTINAVKNKRVYAISGANLSTVSQYVVKGVADVAHVLYPDVKLP
jgi:iron complex transport system substrate-binding protein